MRFRRASPLTDTSWAVGDILRVMFWADGNAIGEKSAISDGHNSLAILNSGDDMVDQIGRAREVEFRIFSRGEFTWMTFPLREAAAAVAAVKKACGR